MSTSSRPWLLGRFGQRRVRVATASAAAGGGGTREGHTNRIQLAQICGGHGPVDRLLGALAAHV